MSEEQKLKFGSIGAHVCKDKDIKEGDEDEMVR